MSQEPTSSLVIAADLGGTHLRAALVDQSGRIHAQLKRDTPHGESANCIVESLASAAAELSSQLKSAAPTVVSAAIMVPGTVDKTNTVVVSAPNLPCLDNFALKAALQEKMNLPVLLENDANAAAVGEMWLGAARGYSNVICITLGTGVGGGIVLDGKLWRGADGSAGEIGHTTVEPFSGPPCKCGNHGCLEVFASATAIVRMAKEDFDKYPHSTLGLDGLTALKVYNAGIAGDKLSIDVFKRAGRYLGVGLANIITLLGPEVIVIGGGAANGWSLFEEEMMEQIEGRVFPSRGKNVKIVTAECGDNAGLVGAAKLAFDMQQL
ncbi:MAG: ROK family protein [Blastocatellia bacterium]|nr:MAG: ROK family protein [Blastocatellia bacterium]